MNFSLSTSQRAYWNVCLAAIFRLNFVMSVADRLPVPPLVVALMCLCRVLERKFWTGLAAVDVEATSLKGDFSSGGGGGLKGCLTDLLCLTGWPIVREHSPAVLPTSFSWSSSCDATVEVSSSFSFSSSFDKIVAKNENGTSPGSNRRWNGRTDKLNSNLNNNIFVTYLIWQKLVDIHHLDVGFRGFCKQKYI